MVRVLISVSSMVIHISKVLPVVERGSILVLVVMMVVVMSPAVDHISSTSTSVTPINPTLISSGPIAFSYISSGCVNFSLVPSTPLSFFSQVIHLVVVPLM